MANNTIILKAKDQTRTGIQSAIGSIKSLDNQVTSVTKTLSALGKLTVVAAIGTAFQKAGRFALDAANEFGTAQRTLVQLSTALGGNEARIKNNTDLIERMADKTLEDKDTVEQLVAKLASLGKSDKEIEKLTNASIILSNVTGDSVDASFMKLNGTLTGSAGKLEKLDSEFGNLTKEQLENEGAIDLVIKKYGAISDSMAGGWSQSVKNFGDSWGDLKESMGRVGAEFLQPMIDKIGDIAQAWANAIDAQKKYDEIQKKKANTKTLEDQRFEVEYRLKQIEKEKNAERVSPTLYNAGKALNRDEEEKRLRAELAQMSNDLAANERAIAYLQEQSAIAAEKRAEAEKETAELRDKYEKGYNAENDTSLYTESSMEGVGGANDLDKLKSGGGWVDPDSVDQWIEQAFLFRDAWDGALSTISERFVEWEEFASSAMVGIADRIGSALSEVGTALVNGENAWSAFGSAAIGAVGEILKALGAQLAAMAAIELIKGNFVGAGLATAGAAAAYIAGGAITASAQNMDTGSSTSSSGESPNYLSTGSAYTGPETVVVNNYMNGTFYSEADLEKRLTAMTLNAISERSIGMATAY